MKMVILGASAPKCDKKPQNPTSASMVGTMSGSNATGGARLASRGATAGAPHRPQYQGLLQAPRLSEIFDHRMIKSNFEEPGAGNWASAESGAYDSQGGHLRYAAPHMGAGPGLGQLGAPGILGQSAAQGLAHGGEQLAMSNGQGARPLSQADHAQTRAGPKYHY